MLLCRTKDVKLIDSWTSAANLSANVMPIWHITQYTFNQIYLDLQLAQWQSFLASEHKKKCTAELPRNVACDHGGGKEDNTKVTHQKDQNHGPMPRFRKIPLHSELSMDVTLTGLTKQRCEKEGPKHYCA